jgi:hypothetical protein
MKNFSAFIALVVALFSINHAHAIPGVGFGIMAGPNMTFPSVDLPAGASVTGTIGYSVGPTVGLGPIELSALYSSYGTKISILGLEETTSAKSLDIPVLYRLGLGTIGVGIGGFYSLSLESGSTSDDNNYGAVGSVRVGIPGIKLFVDGRFNLGLKDNDGKISNAQLMIGYNFL